MKRKKLATMLVVAFAISATSVAPVMGAENEDISKYDCDYKPWLEMNAGVSDVLASAWASETTFEPYWTTTTVNVRTKPNTDSEIVTTLLWNQQVSVASFDNEWDLIYWEIFEERTELCHKALRARHERLLGTSSDVAPILWQHGAYARLKKHEKIDRLLYDGYSTISLGYAGLYECVKFMTGHSHSDEGIGEEFGLKVMQALNDKCNQWKQAENIDYSLYGTPLESTTYKFAKCLKSRFGNDIFEKLDGFDRNYITNSYHIPVFEHITAFEKLRIESKFQKLSPGGAISYIEIPSMSHNISAILEVIKFIYNNIMYAEINTKSCYCEKCGFDGDIPLVSDENNRLKWECPSCGNTDNTTMDIAFRVCGYIGTAKNGGNQGRYGDIHDRVYHLDDMEYTED